jgi:GR25 family glycosyltransferase involved in LPS biosynthesis
MQLGQLYERKSDGFANTIYYYTKALTFDADRIEGHAFAMTLLRTKNLHLFVMALAEQVFTYAMPTSSKLFLFKDCYDYVIEYNCSISAYYTKKPDLGYTCCKRIFANYTRCSDAVLESTCTNLLFYKEQMAADADVLALFHSFYAYAAARMSVTAVHDAWTALYAVAKPHLCRYRMYKPPSTPPKDAVLLTITSCKRLDLFMQTINSIVNQWTDKHLITEWVCVDDNSSKENRKKMRKLYPWITFYMKKPAEKGHRASMNIIWDMLKRKGARYWIHLEDDFLFHESRSYVKDATRVLKALYVANIRQVLFNRNYAETVEDQIKGHTVSAVAGIVEHAYKLGDFPYINCHYWPHYSFRPSVTDVAAILELGNFDSPNVFFEKDYAIKWTAGGYRSAFFDAITCTHTGKLTTEHHVKNAYALNDVDQGLGTMNPSVSTVSDAAKQPIIQIVNLKRRPDRKSKMIETLTAAGFNPKQYAFVEAVDGQSLESTASIAQLFKGNDFGFRKGIVGCALSHLNIWMHLAAEPSVPYTIVLEDDIHMVPDFSKHLQLTLKHVGTNDLVFFGYSMQDEARASHPEYNATVDKPIIRPLNRGIYVGGMICYYLSQAGAQKLMQYVHANGIQNGIDYFLKIMPGLTIGEVVPQLVFSEWYKYWDGKDVDSDIQKSHDVLKFKPKDSYVFVQGLDITANDLYHKKQAPVWQAMQLADSDPACVGFNTLGFFKSAVTSLQASQYFSGKDGVYIKQPVYEAYLTKQKAKENGKKRVRVQMLCNWCSSEALCNEWNKFSRGDCAWDQLQLVSDPADIDYWVIINKPQAHAVYDPARTLVLQMEPWCGDDAATWGVKTWGEWAKPDHRKFLYVGDRSVEPNLGFWQIEWTYDDFVNKPVVKSEASAGVVSSICSSKYFDIGHKKRIDFLRHVEAQNDPDVKLAIYSHNNSMGFKSYMGTATPDVDKSRGIMPYQYYFMAENNAERNFITEKLWEALLCECLCFYWGAPNVADWVDPRSYIVLDLDNFDDAFRSMKTAIAGNAWAERLPYIRREKQRVLHHYSFFPTIDRVLVSKKHAHTVCFIHSCHLEKAGTAVLDGLLSTLITSGCADTFQSIQIYNSGAALDAGQYARYIGSAQTHQLEEGPEAFEVPTLKKVHAYCVANPLARVLYIHTKGVSYGGTPPNVKDWTDFMMYKLVEQWKDRIEDLKTHDCVGVNHALTPHPHFSGNFWWANAAHVRTLNPGALTDKHSAEWWLLSAPAKHVSAGQSNKNHYLEAWPRSAYA